jgi:hypothetical protein
MAEVVLLGKLGVNEVKKMFTRFYPTLKGSITIASDNAPHYTTSHKCIRVTLATVACYRRNGAGNALIFQTAPVGVADNSREAARTGTRAGRPPLCIRKPNEFGGNAKTCRRTFANTSWRSVQTCLVLLRTEAGVLVSLMRFMIPLSAIADRPLGETVGYLEIAYLGSQHFLAFRFNSFGFISNVTSPQNPK